MTDRCRDRRRDWWLRVAVVVTLAYGASGSTMAAASGAETCGSCHSTSGWQPAKFNHQRTNFPLKGMHSKVLCGQCHENNNYQKITKSTCADCHHDPHLGELGKSCEKCHQESGWLNDVVMSGSLLAHRRTNFPLSGSHAQIPCQECHQTTRERTFSRVAKGCYDCHQTQYLATRGTAIDHAALNFSTRCESCHTPMRWSPSTGFSGHDNCFVISRGPHANYSCTDCHTSFTGTLSVGSCSGTNFSCTGCHTGAHSQSRMNSRHSDVSGYQWRDGKCFECHHTGTTTGD